MDKMKRFIECYIPIESCNLKCPYCYITQKGKLDNKHITMKHSLDEFRSAFRRKRWGGVCLINLCAGGETLLPKDILSVIRILLEAGHYVSVVTNGTLTDRFDEISKWPKKLKSHLFIKFSFHYMEMRRLNMMERFFNNVNMMHRSGVSITVELTPHDELVPYIEDIKKVCMDNLGALCHITIARDESTPNFAHLSKYSYEEYKKIWGVFDSALFDFKKQWFYKKPNEFCYMGEYGIFLNLVSGDYSQCYSGRKKGNIFNLNKPIKYLAMGKACPAPHCWNCHSFFALGCMPGIADAPFYSEVRNRVCEDGSEWLKPEVKAFFSQKLYDNNPVYSRGGQFCVTLFQAPNFIIRYIRKGKIAIRTKLKRDRYKN